MQFVILSEDKITYSLELRDFNLLQCLLKSEDFVATRKELLIAGWPGRIVSETSLNVAIMKLRKKTDEFSDIVQIKTISGHGYRVKLAEGVRFIESEEEIKTCLEDLERKQKEQVVLSEGETNSGYANSSKTKSLLGNKGVWGISLAIVVIILLTQFVLS